MTNNKVIAMRLRAPKAREPYRPIAALHKRRPMSVRELGKRTGIHFTYIARVLAGERRPSIAHLVRIAQALGFEPVLVMRPRRKKKAA